MTIPTPKQKPATHTFILDGREYTRTSPRVYTHIIIGDDRPCTEFKGGHVCNEYCNRTGLQLGWSSSEANARKTARTMENRKVFVNVRVFPITRREAR